MIIIFRHAKDDEKAASYDHDAHITNQGAAEIPRMVLKLIEKYGIPDMIITSPFVRARETTAIIRSTLKTNIKPDKFKKIKFKCDTRLSRYFTSEQQKDPSIRPDTKKFNPPIYESINEFVDRLRKILFRLIDRGYGSKDGPIVWCVSHGLAVKKMLYSVELKYPESVKPLAVYPIYFKNSRFRFV